PDLENETYYVVQIVRKPSQTMAEQTSESIGSLTSSSVTGPLQTISKNFNFDDFSVTVKLGNKLPGEYVRSGETLLYHYYFRTSRYNSLREKLADLDFEIEKISSPIELFKLSGDIPEKFEEYEINGYYKGGVKRLEPLLKFVAPFTYNYHTQNVNPKVYEVYWTLNNLKRSDPVLRDILLPIFNRHRRGLPPILGVDLSSRTDVGFPIQDWEIERQAGVRRQPESSSDDTASTSSGSSGSATATGPSISTSPGSGLSASGGIGGVSVSNPGVSSLFAGTTSNIFSASILEPSGSSSRTYDLELFYTTSTYVKLDVVNLKRSLSRIFLYRDAAGRYRYQLQLSSQHRTEYLQLLSALTTNNAMFNYSRGTYGFSIQYHMPILGGGGYASPSQRKNSELTQIFNY
ncbi:MAG: hypothetical protein KAI99_21350, partial [Cyclobacteriaceae bacterium]|nr:hypothetical protein [Cyclobacteriaceae bacterium]